MQTKEIVGVKMLTYLVANANLFLSSGNTRQLIPDFEAVIKPEHHQVWLKQINEATSSS